MEQTFNDRNNVPNPLIRCYSDVKVAKVLWTIHNFSSCQGVLTSAPFSIGPNDAITWCLKLHPKETDSDEQDFVVIYLFSLYDSIDTGKYKYMFSMLNAKQEECGLVEAQMVQDTSSEGGSVCYSKFVLRDFLMDKINGLVPGDKLRILCEIRVDAGPSMKVPECRLPDDYGLLLQSQKHSDVTLLVDGKHVKAHKAILAARSPVFSAMFEHQMKESKSSEVEIVDINEKVVKEMLCFIYTGRAPNLKEIAHDLFIAADRYGLERLKAMCEEIIGTNLCVNSAMDTLILADLHSAVHLKAYAIEFISAHAVKVMDTDNWKTKAVHHPHLLYEVCQALANQRSRISPTGQTAEGATYPHLYNS